jgi:hypothetical protein
MADDKVTMKSVGGVEITLEWDDADERCMLRVAGTGADLSKENQRALLHELALGKPSARPAAPAGPVFSRGRAIAAASTRMKLEQLHQAKAQAKVDYDHLIEFIDRQIAAKTPAE